MKICASILSLALGAVPVAAMAQQSTVVLELYTSQGCSTCPPADALLEDLSRMDGVIALALHVTIWDYQGWKDTFGKSAFNKRQKSYARSIGQRTVFTPQMIIQGEDMLIGYDAETIHDRIAAHRARPSPVALRVRREGDGLRIALEPRAAGLGMMNIQVVRFSPKNEVLIESGENEGHHMHYTNVVTDWTSVGHWDGLSVAEHLVPSVGPGPVAVIVQLAPLGPIVSAMKLP